MFKEELNLMLEISDFLVKVRWAELRGTDSLYFNAIQYIFNIWARTVVQLKIVSIYHIKVFSLKIFEVTNSFIHSFILT